MVWGQINTSQISRIINQLKENSIQSLFLIPAFMPINETNVIEFKNGLGENKSLVELYMHGHDLGLEGLKEIGKCIEKHPNLKSISIGSTDIGLKCNELEILLKGVLRSKTLKSIDFSKQSINSESLRIIKEIVIETGNKSITHFNFSENNLDSESLIHLEGIIQANENIEILNLGGNEIDGDVPEGFINTIISSGKHLKKLVLSGNPIKDESSLLLSKLLLESNSLKELELNDCEIGSLGGEILGNSLLKWKGTLFTATGNPLMGHHLTSKWTNIQQLGQVSTLKHLSLRGCFIGEEGLKGIISAIRKGFLPNLNLLDVAYNKLSLESLESLKELVVIDQHHSKHSLEYLDISFNLFGRKAKEIVIDWISSNKITNLKCLSLNNVDMRFMDMFEICKSLVDHNTSFKLFELMGNDQRDEEQIKKEAEQLKLQQEKEQQRIESGKEEDEDEDEDEEESVYDILFDNINELKSKKLEFKWK
ncbi:hypothetical protein DICPUDRAFT_26374 [Dictyostelium purpureum]|uniref:Uncharacterized protein n=1 Tax=Dictyostelium purpureum TaxID=5786 RepID=F0Z8L2_DICPU|nr:uncharacterized protein DICPUDRAFT_26374 [Dictyostelium purpureum]EGC39747.1 hypothetical protein DICPUDRAFT_26374 [Dictyostelium purpureum]|eukprot:XP_003283733.1 hypothetical protein DICPUDRAFT_26374 [Dictyostelium purpureum]